MEQPEVIISGAGPTGLALACGLLRHKISFVILDRNQKTTLLSKAMVVHARTLEIFNETGLALPAIAMGQKATQFNMMTRGKIRGKLQLSAFGEGSSQFPFALILEQSKTESLMADYLPKNGIDIQWDSEVIAFEDSRRGVSVSYKNSEGKVTTIRGNYLVGCDGASSFTRHKLGLGFSGATRERIFYVADVKIQSRFNNHNEAWFVMVENGFALFFPMEGEQHYRVIGTVPDHFDDPENITFAAIKQTIQQQLQTPVDFLEEYWFSTYKVHSRMVENFSKGNCFVAGDAAHIHTPAGGQGMNTGIQDAYNLGWKLAFVIQGKADKKLLETYNEERKANARRLLKSTDRMFDLLAGTGWFSNLMRLYLFPMILNRITKMRFFNRRIFPLISMIGVKYPQSALTVKSKVAKIEAGDRMPYFETGGKSIYEYLKDPAFKILYFGSASDRLTEITARFDLVKIPFSEIPAAFKSHKNFYIVLRPDNYIAYIGNDIQKIEQSLAV